MNKKTLITIIGVPMFCLLLWAFFKLPQLMPPTQRTPAVKLQNLLLSVDDLEGAWIYYQVPIPYDSTDPRYWGEERLSLHESIRRTDEKAWIRHTVFKFRNVYDSKRYQGDMKDSLYVMEGKNDILPYTSPYADYWYSACENGLVKNLVVCEFFGRYDEFFSYVSISYDKKIFAPSDFIQVLSIIDERFNAQLNAINP